ncbi:hypothetical protein AWL63_10940 [Sphingomonas panacis]|uniref:Uncharacterized protein n=1 Tax=Sphingomonas panacis TaxID=1560345 RepID=A0A1B3ZAG2_9SPHN|nr:hypothetical protein AWL63_10940 [Sphingomonas panacis]
MTGDIFRLVATSDGPWRWHQDENVYWLSQLVGGALASNPDIKVGVLDHAALGLSPSNFGPKDGSTLQSWWVESVGSPLSSRLAARIRKAVAGKVVIAFEISSDLRAILEGAALALLEVEVAPIRFLSGILLSAQSTHPELQAAIDSETITERELQWQFGIMRARMGRPTSEGEENFSSAVLIAGQMPADRALIDAGKLLDLGNFVDDLRRLSTDRALVILTPHPHSANSIAGLEKLASIASIKISRANSYRLLATGKIDLVVAISSSLLEEAKFFGASSVRLAPPRQWKGVTIDVRALGGALANGIARVSGFMLPPLKRPFPDEPISPQNSANIWAYAGIQNASPIFTGMAVGADPVAVSAADVDFAAALTFGWHQLEPWGVWSGRVGVLGIAPLGDPGALSCAIELRSPWNDATQFEIWWDGERVQYGEIPAGPSTTVRFEVSGSTKPGPLQIWLVCDRTFTPSEQLPGYLDHRELGLALSAITIAPARG